MENNIFAMPSEYQVAFTRVSKNAKTGPIPVTTTEEGSCPDACPLKKNGCYADSGPLALFWRKVTERKAGMAWSDMLLQVAALPKGQLWRHNQAGDLAGLGDQIDVVALEQLVKANKGRRGFTYTHKPMSDPKNRAAVAEANRQGFTINLSANNLAEADQLAALGIGPVAVVVPIDQTTATQTPEGRKVAICPAAISESVSCATCGLCALRDRKAIIGFPAHGTSKRKAEAVAKGGYLMQEQGDLYEQERAAYARASRSELRAVERALCFHPWANSPRESARLWAVRDLLAKGASGL